MKCLFWTFNCFLYCHSKLFKGIPKYFYMFCFAALAYHIPRSQLKIHCQGLLSWCVAELVTHLLVCQESVSGSFIWLSLYFGKQRLFTCFKRRCLLCTNYIIFSLFLVVPFFLAKPLSLPLSFLYFYVRFMVQRIEQRTHAGEYCFFITSARAMVYNFLV